MIKISAASKSYEMKAETIKAVSSASFTVNPGECVALMGPSGCGKTTLLSLVSGLLAADSGSIEVLGTQLTKLDPDERAAFRLRNVGVVFQDTQLIPEFTVLENVLLPMELSGVSRGEALKLARVALSQVGLDSQIDRFPDEISGGQAQRVGIARAIVGGRKVLLADEPTGSLDQENSRMIFSVLRNLALSGLCVLISTHDPLIEAYATRILPMSDGKLL
jgi:putative ABC transport system ATP-binding protein